MKQVIILEQSRGPGGDIGLRFAFWFSVAVGREVPRPGATSAYRLADQATEVAPIQAGTVIEEVAATQYPSGTTVSTIKADLQSRYTTRQAVLAGLPDPNQFYGSFWDGATWTIQGT